MSIFFEIILGLFGGGRVRLRHSVMLSITPLELLQRELDLYGVRGFWQTNQSRIREERDLVFIDNENIEAIRQRLNIYDASETSIISRWFTRLFTPLEKHRTLLCYYAASKLLSLGQSNPQNASVSEKILYYQNLLKEHAPKVTSSLKQTLLSILESFGIYSPKKESIMANRNAEVAVENNTSHKQSSPFLSGVFNWFNPKTKTLDEVINEKQSNLLKAYKNALRQLKEIYAEDVDLFSQISISTQHKRSLKILEKFINLESENKSSEHKNLSEKLERASLHFSIQQSINAVTNVSKILLRKILKQDASAISNLCEIVKCWLQSPFERLQSTQYISKEEKIKFQKVISSQLKACLDKEVPRLKKSSAPQLHFNDWLQVWYSVFPKDSLKRIDDKAQAEAKEDVEKMLEHFQSAKKILLETEEKEFTETKNRLTVVIKQQAIKLINKYQRCYWYDREGGFFWLEKRRKVLKEVYDGNMSIWQQLIPVSKATAIREEKKNQREAIKVKYQEVLKEWSYKNETVITQLNEKLQKDTQEVKDYLEQQEKKFHKEYTKLLLIFHPDKSTPILGANEADQLHKNLTSNYEAMISEWQKLVAEAIFDLNLDRLSQEIRESHDLVRRSEIASEETTRAWLRVIEQENELRADVQRVEKLWEEEEKKLRQDLNEFENKFIRKLQECAQRYDLSLNENGDFTHQKPNPGFWQNPPPVQVNEAPQSATVPLEVLAAEVG